LGHVEATPTWLNFKLGLGKESGKKVLKLTY
jgi:hypothetical protein